MEEPLLLILTDQTPVLSLRTQLDASRYRTLQIACSSHEIRNPMSVLLGTLESMQDLVSGKAVESLEVARNTSHYILNLVNDVLVRRI